MDKLYIVVRSDLSPGAQLAQACHAAFQFAIQFNPLVERWHCDSNNLVILQVPDEDSVLRLSALEARSALMREPDMGNQATAVAFGPEAARLLSSLPLALRQKRAA